MKLLLLLLIPAWCFGQNWSGKASNQTISYYDLQDAVSLGVFPATGTTIPSSNQQVKKSLVGTYIINNVTNSYYSAKSSNQILAKRDLTAYANGDTLYYAGYTGGDGSAYGWSNSTLACAHASAIKRVVYWDGTLGVGTHLHNTPPTGLNRYTDGSGNIYYYLSGYYVTIDTAGGDYTIHSLATCGGGTTTVTVYLTAAYNSGTGKWFVTAHASNAVSTTIIVNYTYIQNGTSHSGNSITITAGNTTSTGAGGFVGAGTDTFVANCDSITPSSYGTQTYVCGTP
jgi:hypothetical protein